MTNHSPPSISMLKRSILPSSISSKVTASTVNASFSFKVYSSLTVAGEESNDCK